MLDLGRAARQRANSRGHAVVGCKYRNGCHGRGHRIRLANHAARLLLNFIAAAFGSFAVAVIIAAVFAAVLISVLSLHAAEVMIASAPGAVDAMMLLALALNLDPVYVGAHHLTRIFFVSLTMPFIARRSARTLTIGNEPAKRPSKRPPYQD